MFQSSSPSYLLLCSLDAAVDVATEGPSVWEDALRAAKHVRHAWRASGGTVLTAADSPGQSDGELEFEFEFEFKQFEKESAKRCRDQSQGDSRRRSKPVLRVDPLRVTLLTTDHGMTGYQCAERLEAHGVAVEMATDACVVLALGIGSTLRDAVRAAAAFQKVLAEAPESVSKMLDGDFSPRESGKVRERSGQRSDVLSGHVGALPSEPLMNPPESSSVIADAVSDRDSEQRVTQGEPSPERAQCVPGSPVKSRIFLAFHQTQHNYVRNR